MRFENVRTSSRTTHLFGMLRASTGIGPEAWARASICLSLLQKGIPNPDEYNKEGSEFSPERLFEGMDSIYLALVVNRLRQDGLDPDSYLAEMTRAHLNRGAVSLKQRVDRISDLYRFMEEMGIRAAHNDIEQFRSNSKSVEVISDGPV